MPKVYFYDTGFLCYLLGIESEAQYESSTLRGGLFENMAISELMKSQFNDGRIPEIYFYRERSGKEVDAVVRRGASTHLYEIKAGGTFKPEYTGNMKYVADLLSGEVTKSVIYDGPTSAPLLLNIRDI